MDGVNAGWQNKEVLEFPPQSKRHSHKECIIIELETTIANIQNYEISNCHMPHVLALIVSYHTLCPHPCVHGTELQLYLPFAFLAQRGGGISLRKNSTQRYPSPLCGQLATPEIYPIYLPQKLEIPYPDNDSFLLIFNPSPVGYPRDWKHKHC